MDFELDISTLNDCNVQVGLGVTEVQSVAPKFFTHTINTGAITLHTKEEQIGALYMKVATGMIVSDNAKVRVIPFVVPLQSHSAEAYFEGKLKGQRTELLVGNGAIICKVI